jgi:hypothetical protein
MAKKPSSERVRETVERAIDALREDPRRFRDLLRRTADLLGEVAEGLADAEQDAPAGAVRALSRTVRGAALLPAPMAAALAKKALDKALAAR